MLLFVEAFHDFITDIQSLSLVALYFTHEIIQIVPQL